MTSDGFSMVRDFSRNSRVTFVLDVGGERRAGWVTYDTLLQLEGASPMQRFESYTGLLQRVAIENVPGDGGPVVITFEHLAEGLSQMQPSPQADPSFPHEELTIEDMEKGPMG